MKKINSRVFIHNVLMECAVVISKRSTCLRKQVGCVIAKDGRIIMTGYNGVASGVPHCTECSGPGCDISIHAEAGTISYAARLGIKLEDSFLYVTMSPCINCAKLILNAKIKKVFYLEEYRDETGLNYLRENGVECIKCPVLEMQ